jgi:hypothetical protein
MLSWLPGRRFEAACSVSVLRAESILMLPSFRRWSYERRKSAIAIFLRFSAGELREYVRSHGLAEALYRHALDQRVSDSSAYIKRLDREYEVGRTLAGALLEEQTHADLLDAATDFVLAYWRLPRLNSGGG